ncbi:DoxX family protein [Neisseria zalophi]|uniref:DoxX family protein n=1 Tax=Neisseria zalophi TaxID=640030 RepID=A0A5J6PTK0_9NEIS|nr:DoxX family protein [Neisseria zalophi]QEY25634.1 DoxX family protein [Neisseria zalophi]
MFNPNVLVKNIVTNPTMHALISLIARAFLVYLFLVSGWGKIDKFDGVVAHMEGMGVPGALLPLTILLEVGGGIAILFGFQTRILALLLAAFTLISALIFHAAPEDAVQMMKNFGITGGFLLLMLTGAGAWSIDHLIEKK